MSLIIGLNGDTSSGKSTIAEFLEKEHGYYRFSLTSSIIAYIRQQTNELEPYFRSVETAKEYREAYELVKEKYGREFLISYGKEMRKLNGESAISLASIPMIETLTEKHDKIVIDDLRVGDNFIKEHFDQTGDVCYIIRVESPASAPEELDVNLPSDFTVKNDQSKTKMFETTNQILEKIEK